MHAGSAVKLAEEIRAFGLHVKIEQHRIPYAVLKVEGRDGYISSRESWYRYAESIGIQARPKINVSFALPCDGEVF